MSRIDENVGGQEDSVFGVMKCFCVVRIKEEHCLKMLFLVMV